MRQPMKAQPASFCSALLGLAAVLGAQGAADLRDRDVLVRLKAIDAVGAASDAKVPSLLPGLLKDKDWEVQERAAIALGRLGHGPSLAALADLAINGDVLRVRRAAALAVAAIDPAAGAERIFRKVKGRTQASALEALALVLRGRSGFEDADKLEKLLRDEDAAVREPAAVAWLEGAPDRAAALTQLLRERYLVVRCRALQAVADAPRPADWEPLADAFVNDGQNPVVARRLLWAIAAVIAVSEGDRAARANSLLDRGGDAGLVLERWARLVPLLARGENPVFDDKAAVVALRKSLASPDTGPRAAAAKALREIGGEAALEAALAHFPDEAAPRAQVQLVETVAALRKPTTPEAAKWLTDIAGGPYTEDVRERAIVRLGKSGVKGAVPTLVGSLQDTKWEIGCCAAVSLGKTDDDDALAPLLALLKDADWKLRGAAIVGLMHYSRAAVVEPLIGMLGDDHPVVSRAAHEALRTVSRKYDTKFTAKAWQAWWAEAKGKHDFTDREATLDKLERYGYAVPDSEIYRGLDVIVFQSRGDHIEQLLTRLEIDHRLTAADRILEDGVHPEAIFVSNCTGELGRDDREPLAWFVCTGGSLFGSCWALSETIARIHPGVVDKAPTPGEVLDNVRALPCRAESPLLTGVFPESVVPIYRLEGAHLIRVLDPERCEVLIDSPDAAERHGYGNLAAWFFSGHGVMFDSVNHFDLQGLGLADGLKTGKDRQAYAIDHLALSFADWRETKSQGHWRNQKKAAEVVADLSAFRLLTNFVRSKRIGEY